MKYSKTLRIFIVLFFCCSKYLYAQPLQKLKSLILNADSIILVSHVAPPTIIINKKPEDYQLVLNNQINSRFIKERKLIDSATIIELANFLTIPFRDSIIEESSCFFYPHHSIYIFHGKKLSYIHICFQCEDIECSSDIKLPENDFDQATWQKMRLFLKSQGLKYGFNEEDL
jgi:hypothetical protein